MAEDSDLPPDAEPPKPQPDLSAPPVPPTTETDLWTETATPLVDPVGGCIGAFRILEKLGEGGMGVVYLAEQERPIRRRVAFKVVKLGMDTAAVLARFDAERQALALLDHPNICRILEAGATPDGRPYFVMEHVQGVPITAYCDAKRLGTEERLRLVGKVCDAIEHAHERGIIHRDLKPSNILVCEEHGEPLPKIIDFGVAKATHQRLTERSLFTRFGQLVGTPEYMSPEQAGPGPLGVDKRTDVYSLGVVLYELLVGALPLDPAGLRAEGYEGMLRAIRRTAPVLPSARARSLAPEVADRRCTTPAKLRRSLRGGLDRIVMKTLEKDRLRRYSSCSELREDVERHLSGTPVRARRSIPWMRMAGRALLFLPAVLSLGFLGSAVPRLELEALDLQMRLRAPLPAPDEIAIVAFDTAARERLGEWPRPRSTMGELVRRLDAAGSRIIAFNAVFAEPSRLAPDDDQALASAIEQSSTPVVLAAVGFAGSLPVLLGAGAHTGFADLPRDADDTVRTLTISLNRPTFVESVFRLATGNPFDPFDLPDSVVGPAGIELRINYLGPPGRITTVSMADVLGDDSGPALAALAGRIVLIGATDPENRDEYLTPMGGTMSGTEVHATILENLLRGRLVRRPGRRAGQVVSVLAALAALLWLWNGRRPVTKAGVIVTLLAAYVAIAVLTFRATDVWLPVVLPLFLVLVAGVTATAAIVARRLQWAPVDRTR